MPQALAYLEQIHGAIIRPRWPRSNFRPPPEVRWGTKRHVQLAKSASCKKASRDLRRASQPSLQPGALLSHLAIGQCHAIGATIGAIGQLSLGPGDPWLVCLNLLVRSRSANARLL